MGNTSFTSTASASASKLLRGGGISVKNSNRFGNGVCVDNEGNLYSSSSAPTLTASALSMKIRGGGVCVDNEGNFYSPRSDVAVAVAPQQQEEQERSQQPSLAADHRRTTILASSKSSASHSSSSSSSKTIVPASSSGSKQGQLGLGRRK